LVVEVPDHLVEFMNHGIDTGNLSAVLIDLKAFQAEQFITGFHDDPQIMSGNSALWPIKIKGP
jgi:hypothetical protein